MTMRGLSLAVTLAVLANGLMASGQDFAPGGPSPGGMGAGASAWPPPASSFNPPAYSPSAFDPAPTYRAPVPMPSEKVHPLLSERETEATWYARVDYFHWNERVDGADFVNESGVLTTLGYVRRIGPERFRAELFGGQVGYDGGVQYDDGTSESLISHTNYLGVRGEYDLLYDPAWLPAASFVAGIGTRYWYRDLPDDFAPSGTLVYGYQEAWWTIYPYLGIETRHNPRSNEGLAFFASGRIGATAITHQYVSWDDVSLYPKPALIGQCEIGLRGPSLFLCASFESMNWGESALVRDILQPRSRMLTAGLRAGFSF